jgi:hypothetical protein
MADNKEMFFRSKISVHLSLKQEVLAAGGDTFPPPPLPKHRLWAHRSAFTVRSGGFFPLRQRSLSMNLVNRVC